MRRTDNLVIEGARLIFKNFAGEESKFNRKGNRNFCVILEHDDAMNLMDAGWNIKELNSREDEEPLYYLQTAVSFDNIPPKVVLISGRTKTILDETTIETLDYAEIANVDLIIRPYHWEVNGKTGIKAYLKTMYVTVEVDEFAAKYEDMEEEIPF